MRKYLKYIYCFLFLLSALRSASQNDSVPVIKESPHIAMTLLKTNPLPILFGPIPFTSEYRFVWEETIAKNQSLLFGFSILGKSPILKLLEDTTNGRQPFFGVPVSVKGFRFQTGYRIYLNYLTDIFSSTYGDSALAPEGFYIGPHFSYSSARFIPIAYNPQNVQIHVSHFNMNMLVGYQLFLLPEFAIDVFTGLGYKNNRWIEYYSPTRQKQIDTGIGGLYNSNLKLTLGFNIGFAF